MPTFAAFYRAINGRDPFPWQSRLADHVAATEQWPADVGVPTGLGKTACLDVAVWWLASQADRAPAARTAPTRIWWLVNRHLLVDSTAEHAVAISAALTNPWQCGLSGRSADVVVAIAARLRSLAATSGAPLEVVRLGGGVPTRRPTEPSQPAVLLSTLRMYGSRLLFRGYGTFRSMRPIDAALTGTDSLVILDEAHLAPHLVRLLPALADCTPGARSILGPARSRPTVVALTATGDDSKSSRFDLDLDDEAHPVVRQRLDAAKPVELWRPESGEVERLLARAARALLKGAPGPASCVVFANTPATARAAFDRLHGMAEDGTAELLLLTDCVREREAERTRKRILDPVYGMAASRDPARGRQRHLIVVATQTLEAGADVDAEFLVTEACGVRALTQRLGRLNRLGRHPHARAVYVHLAPAVNEGSIVQWPIYGPEPATVIRSLEAAAARGGTVNLSPRQIDGILGTPGEDPGRAPEILDGLLWEWVKTTTPPKGEAPIEPYFCGVADLEYSVSLIWRAHVPEDGELLWPRPTDGEAVDVPIGEAHAAFGENEVLRRLGPDGATVGTTFRSGLRPGDVIVLATDRGLLDRFGWAPESAPGREPPVVDASIAKCGVPLDAAAIKRLCGISIGDLVHRALGTAADDQDPDEADRTEAAAQILEALAEAPVPPPWEQAEWSELTAALQPGVVTVRNEVARLVKDAAPREPRVDELDELSWADTAVELDRHGQAVAVRSRAIAERLGLPPDLAAVVERAARSHDLGKADGRFQRWLDPDGTRAAPVAKSCMPRSEWDGARAAAGWPKGGRHEALSARLVRRWLDRRPVRLDLQHADLLVHLVISHHGSGRPLVAPVDDHTMAAVSAVIEGAAVDASADLSAIDWNQPARFRRLNYRFGPWGLALLEAIVRQADHTVSGEREVL